MSTKNFLVALGLSTLVATPTFAANISKTATHVVVDRNSQTLKVYNGTEVIAKSRVSTGKSGYTTLWRVFNFTKTPSALLKYLQQCSDAKYAKADMDRHRASRFK